MSTGGGAPTDDGADEARRRARRVLDEHGTTYAARAGITLRDEPAPLFQLLVLCTLASKPLSADLAANAAHALFRAGWRTPQRMREATWQQRVDALGRAHYRRFDESSATRLAETCAAVLDEHRGDLRALRPPEDAGPEEVAALLEALQRFPGIGPTGARIFAREVQAVWPGVRPFVDDRGLRAARALGLPDDPAALAALVEPDEVATLASALGLHDAG